MNWINKYVIKPAGIALAGGALALQILGMAYAGGGKDAFESIRSEYPVVNGAPVERGDTISGLIEEYDLGITVNEFIKFYGIKPNELQAGQTLRFYEASDVRDAIKRIDALKNSKTNKGLEGAMAQSQATAKQKEAEEPLYLIPTTEQQKRVNAAIIGLNEKLDESNKQVENKNWPKYSIPTDFLGNPMSPRTDRYNSESKIVKLESLLGSEQDNSPSIKKIEEVMSQYNIYQIGDYGLVLDEKGDRYKYNIEDARIITSPLEVRSIISMISEKNQSRYQDAEFETLVRGNKITGKTDLGILTYGPMKVVRNPNYETLIIPEGQQEELNLKFEKVEGKKSGNNGTGGTGGAGGGAGGGRGGNSGGKGGNAHLKVPHNQKSFAAKATNWRNV